MRQGNAREVAALAWPLSLGMVSYTVMGVVDTLLMGQVSTEALAGVGLSNLFIFTSLSFFRGITSGAQSLVAAADGARMKGRLEAAASAGVLIGLISGLIAALALVAVTTLLLPVALRDEAVRGAATDYLWICLLGQPLALSGAGMLAALQGLGHTRVRMWGSLVGNALNVALDLVLIFGWGPFPRMEAQGAALASLISAGAMWALYAYFYRQHLRRVIKPPWAIIRDAILLGLPTGLQAISGMGAMLLINLLLAEMGAAQLAASEIAINIISVSFLPGYGIAEAGSILVGRYLGGKRLDAAARAVASARALALAVMGLCGLVFVLWGEQIVARFSPDPVVIAIAARLLLYAAAFQLFDALAMVHMSALRGAGDTRFNLVVGVSCSWGLMLPTAVGMGYLLEWGAEGAWLGLLVEISALALISGWRVRGLARGDLVRFDHLLGEPQKKDLALTSAAAPS
ncbi:MATE family efflux transporter [Myxococcota bacterium]|nr:MATE family efflux transporter [Myxococcota bacterium]